MFEFKPNTLEALREALSSGQINVSRGLQSKSFLADFQLIGTTNLCPCGKWTPGQMRNCSFNERRCHSILQKLSGPLLDRIQGFFYFSDKADRPQIPVEVLKQQLKEVRDFRRKQNRSGLNRNFQDSQLNPQELKMWTQFLQNFGIGSVRRRQSTLAWARTLADLDLSDQIKASHLQKAYDDCVLSLTNLLKH